MNDDNMYIDGGDMSTTAKTQVKKNKHFILDQTRIKQAQKILRARTETETIEKALDRVISEDEANRIAWAAHEEFIEVGRKEGLVIEDVFGRLEK